MRLTGQRHFLHSRESDQYSLRWVSLDQGSANSSHRMCYDVTRLDLEATVQPCRLNSKHPQDGVIAKGQLHLEQLPTHAEGTSAALLPVPCVGSRRRAARAYFHALSGCLGGPRKQESTERRRDVEMIATQLLAYYLAFSLPFNRAAAARLLRSKPLASGCRDYPPLRAIFRNLRTCRGRLVLGNWINTGMQILTIS